MVASTPELGRHDIADGHRGAADLAVDRRADFGVVEIDLRLLLLRLRGKQLRLVDSFVGARAIDRRLLAGGCVQQRFGAAEKDRGVRSCALSCSTAASLAATSASNGPLLELVEQIAVLDFRAFHESAARERR